MKKIIGIIRYVIDFLHAKINPVSYAIKIGVNVGDRVKLFSLHPGAFGSEPYLVTLGSDVILTAGVRFITHDGSTFIFRKNTPDLDVMGPINVGDNTFIGMGSVILPGVSIGCNCVIGAMSVVTRSIPDGAVAIGSPARVCGNTDQLLDKLKNKNSCTGMMSPEIKRSVLLKMNKVTDSEGRVWLIKD
ncbi:acetyltransferase (isoleucine patch superfamily) [Leptothrix ochracea L12]|uniref:Acetyltransferase (Isoleucine patch superfamily) n=1 Tax=Leptothrix ochracea L12 TaxID=735332 RepID=I4Z519_9BURK|nr:acyltransferase [Leptothrix ochracea]EIM31311.1 acetyltransferase (isoleucine patch superfamily) [Leptothrix ochracea L12]